MNIALIETTVARTFGSTRRIVEVCNALNDLGHNAHIYAKNGRQPGWIELRNEAKLWGALTKDGPFDLALFNKSSVEELNLVRKAKAEVRAFYVLGWGETRLEEIEREIKAERPGPGLSVVRQVFDDPDFLILACSSWIGEHLRARYRNDTETLLGGINREHFRPYPNPNDGGLRIYYSGDPRTRKGTDIVRKAVSEALQRSRHMMSFQDSYWRKGLTQVQMGHWYSEATIFADGQFWAGWNNPVLEAMACKTPVVCTDIGGVRDFARHNETALLVPPKDHKAMAGALMKLMKSPKLRTQLAENAYEAVAEFTWERTARRLVKLVEERL